MNILVIPPNDIIENALPNRIYHIIRNLENKHQLYLLRYPCYPTSNSSIKRELVRIDIIPRVKCVSDPSLYYVINAPSIYTSLLKTRRSIDIDVIIHSNILPSLFALKIFKDNKTLRVFDFLDYYPESASSYYTNKIQRNIVYTVVNNITYTNLRLSDIIVTHSYTIRKIVEKIKGNDKVYLIPNGVDFSFFVGKNKNEIRKNLMLEEYNPIFIYYGSIAYWLEMEKVLRALSKLKKKYPNFLFLIIGKIYNWEVIRSILLFLNKFNMYEHVKIMREVKQDLLVDYISASDILIAPYRRDLKNYVVPLKVIETLAIPRPVLITDIVEYKLWFKNLVHYYSNEYDFITKVDKILNNYDSILADLSRKRKELEKKFSWKSLSEKYEKIIAGAG